MFSLVHIRTRVRIYWVRKSGGLSQSSSSSWREAFATHFLLGISPLRSTASKGSASALRIKLDPLEANVI